MGTAPGPVSQHRLSPSIPGAPLPLQRVALRPGGIVTNRFNGAMCYFSGLGNSGPPCNLSLNSPTNGCNALHQQCRGERGGSWLWRRRGGPGQGGGNLGFKTPYSGTTSGRASCRALARLDMQASLLGGPTSRLDSDTHPHMRRRKLVVKQHLATITL